MKQMWMVNTKILCKKHLLKEHDDIHFFINEIARGISLHNYVYNNKLEMQSLRNRHEEITREMASRAMEHTTPLPVLSWSCVEEVFEDIYHKRINARDTFKELLKTCKTCRRRADQLMEVYDMKKTKQTTLEDFGLQMVKKKEKKE